MDHRLAHSLETLEVAFHAMEAALPPPKAVPFKDGYVWRYQEQLIEQALILKLARYMSGLRAAHLLLDWGFLQEQGVLQRTLDEMGEDILFLALAITNGPRTERHDRYLQAFWAEEFEEVNDRLVSVRRDTPRRDKIRAHIHNTLTTDDPSRAIENAMTVNSAYSGYVHAAAVHILDMYGGNPPHFHIGGMRNAPLFDDHAYDIWNYFYRGILLAEVVAKALGSADLAQQLQEYGFKFEKASERNFGTSVRNNSI